MLNLYKLKAVLYDFNNQFALYTQVIHCANLHNTVFENHCALVYKNILTEAIWLVKCQYLSSFGLQVILCTLDNKMYS